MNQPTIKYLKKNFDEIAILSCLGGLAYSDGFEITEANQTILSALRRSSSEFSGSSIDEISAKLATYDPEQIGGLVSNIKGITHEMEFVKLENEDGDNIFASLYTDTNHPGFDVEIYDEDTGEYWDSQLKATDDKSYVDDWIENHPDGEILVTDELATKMGLDSSGIENADVTMRVEDFVDELIKSDQANSLSTYFPVIAIASVAFIVQEIYRRYKAGEISYSKFKLLVGIAVGEKTVKIGVLMLLLAIPGINIVIGAGLVAGLVYSARKFATDNL